MLGQEDRDTDRIRIHIIVVIPADAERPKLEDQFRSIARLFGRRDTAIDEMLTLPATQAGI